MSKNLKFYTIDTEYIKYLRNIDNRVADTSIENKKEKRKFIGILLKIDNKNYLAPLSSKKEKFLKMKNSIDFIKINSGLEGAINLNNMIPVYNQFISEYKVEEELDVKYISAVISLASSFFSISNFSISFLAIHLFSPEECNSILILLPVRQLY